jgi:hypothetical protein
VEDSEPAVCQTAAIGNTALFITASADQLLIADMFGSGFDTVLAVYSGPSPSPSFER